MYLESSLLVLVAVAMMWMAVLILWFGEEKVGRSHEGKEGEEANESSIDAVRTR